LNLNFNRRNFLLIFFVLLIITIGYEMSEFSEKKTDLLVGYAIAGVEKCGCSTCHTIELNRCAGCHNSPQRKQKSNESTSSSEESNGSDSAVQGNDHGSQESPSGSVDKVSSDPGEVYKDNLQNPEIVPNKYKNQKGSAKAQT
jgi:hypothetical protein